MKILPDMQLELVSGRILDRYTIEDDCVDLTANHGAYLFDDVLAVLAVRRKPEAPCQARPLDGSKSGKMVRS